jgi:hypothetical protein
MEFLFNLAHTHENTPQSAHFSADACSNACKVSHKSPLQMPAMPFCPCLLGKFRTFRPADFATSVHDMRKMGCERPFWGSLSTPLNINDLRPKMADACGMLLELLRMLGIVSSFDKNKWSKNAFCNILNISTLQAL